MVKLDILEDKLQINEVKGFKAFDNAAVNRYGKQFIEGETYKANGNIKFGSHGYHFCTTITDVFRYVDAINSTPVVARVTGRGTMNRFNDEYNGYYNMYAVSEITIDHFMSEEEIIEEILKCSEFDVVKALKTKKFISDEIRQIINNFNNSYNVLCAIMYYQLGIKDVYEYPSEEINEIRKKMLKNG